MPTDPTSLTSEERALAERLARMGPNAAPSPAMDARVLAAARDAVASAPRRRSRWPAVFGLAASLLLAVGIAWRLRPLPDVATPMPAATAASEAPAAATQEKAAAAMSDTLPAESGSQDSNLNSEPVVAADTAAAAAANDKPQIESRTMAPVARGKRVDEVVPAPEPSAVLDAAAAMQAAPAPAEVSASSPQAFSDAASPAPPAPPPPPARETTASEPSPPGLVGNEAARAANASGDEPELDVPPATADSPEVRDAWLQRIQTLVDGGDIEGARASLRAFVARYPAYTLPENLRALTR